MTITTPKITGKPEDLFLCEPSAVVDLALYRLQKAGVALIEWRSLLYRRMNVPFVIKVSVSNYSPALSLHALRYRTTPTLFPTSSWKTLQACSLQWVCP